MLSEMLRARGGLLLIWFTWPFALITMIVAHVKRIWKMGTMYSNASFALTSNASDHLSNGDHVGLDPRLLLSAVQLSQKIKDPNDSLTSRELVELCISQIKRVDPYVRAVVATRFDQARAEADIIDKKIRDAKRDNSQEIIGSNLPFYGVPLVVKENFEIKGLPYTAGIVGRKGTLGQETGPVLQQVQKQTGGIILASTNVSEACMWHESNNHLYGVTNNPYDFSRTAGGSSGGCGAAVASCMTPISIGSDVGGSIRIPAHYNGLFGHKPTGGSVSNANTIPSCGSGDIQRFCQMGPLTKRSEDLWPLFVAMKTPADKTKEQNLEPVSSHENPSNDACDDKSETSSGEKSTEWSLLPEKVGECCQNVKDLLKVDFSKLVVYYTKRNLGSSLFLSALPADTSTKIDNVLGYLEQQGATLVDIEEEETVKEMFEGLNAFRAWSALMAKHRHQPFAVTIRENKPQGEVKDERNQKLKPLTFVSTFIELLKSLFDLSSNTFPALLLSFAEFISDLPAMQAEKEKFSAWGLSMKEELEYLLSPEYSDDCHSCSSDDASNRKSSDTASSLSENSEALSDKVFLSTEMDHTESSSNRKDSPPDGCKPRVVAKEHILLLPSLPTPAPFHAESIMRVFDTSNTSFFNVMELPATAVPLGLSNPPPTGGKYPRRSRSRQPSTSRASHMPVGMQIVGGPKRDHVTIGVAMALEEAGLVGWTPPISR